MHNWGMEDGRMIMFFRMVKEYKKRALQSEKA
jgi:hypothetical protein